MKYNMCFEFEFYRQTPEKRPTLENPFREHRFDLIFNLFVKRAFRWLPTHHYNARPFIPNTYITVSIPAFRV